MEKSLHYLLMADHLLIQKAFLAAIKETGLTPVQPKILDYLLYHDGARVRGVRWADSPIITSG